MSKAEYDGALLRSLAPELAARTAFFERCQSTNDEARRLARDGAADGTLVLTERQEAGRGRRGQAWHCPAGEGIACSLVIRPTEPAALWPRLALAAGLGVAEGLARLGVHADLKWPNDLQIQGRKLGGILTEVAGGEAVICGVGLNVSVTDFPTGLQTPATSLLLATGRLFDREEVLAVVVPAVLQRCREIGVGFSELCQAWSQRSSLNGEKVTLQTAAGGKTGTVTGIGSSGELLLETEQGIESILQAEEVRLVGDAVADTGG